VQFDFVDVTGNSNPVWEHSIHLLQLLPLVIVIQEINKK